MRVIVLLALCSFAAFAAEPDYSAWDALLEKYYDPQRGMDYRALKSKDAPTLAAIRARLGNVHAPSLSRDQQLAYWINLYNVNVVGIVVDHYPVKSIRDISTDPVRRLNVFQRDLVPYRGGKMSLDEIEHEQIRKGFRDPRIHFAINCAARSCPPMPRRAIRGAQLNQVLDQQTRQFLSGVKIDGAGVHLSRIMDWFREDFDRRGGGMLPFIRRYLPPAKQKQLHDKIRLVFDNYDWSLNQK